MNSSEYMVLTEWFDWIVANQDLQLDQIGKVQFTESNYHWGTPHGHKTHIGSASPESGSTKYGVLSIKHVSAMSIAQHFTCTGGPQGTLALQVSYMCT